MLLPLSFNLDGKNILLIGGGKAALEKFAQLKRTACQLKIVTSRISDAMAAALKESYPAQVSIHMRAFEPADLADVYMVFSAVDDTQVAQQIFELCRAQNLLINSADDKARCDFYTNALIDRGSVQVTVSTHGRFAGLSAIIKRHLEQLLPDELEAEWEKVFALRERAVALQSVDEKKSVITNIVREIETKYFGANIK